MTRVGHKKKKQTGASAVGSSIDCLSHNYHGHRQRFSTVREELRGGLGHMDDIAGHPLRGNYI